MNKILNLQNMQANKDIVETLPAIDFIKLLIRHIPEKHFKMIRDGGLYARHRKTDEKDVYKRQEPPVSLQTVSAYFPDTLHCCMSEIPVS